MQIAWNLLIVSVLFLIFLAGVIWLQIFLSKKESKWPGLVLPFISLCLSLFIVFGLVAFNYMGSTELVESVMEDGEVVEQHITQTKAVPTPFGEMALILLMTFLPCNIPTAILLAIYGACRGQRKKNQSLVRMKIQDL